MSKGVFFDIMLDDKFLGRVSIKLFDAAVPLTAKNFRAFAVGYNGKTYAGTAFHRIYPTGIVGGDVDRNDGTGGHSVYGPRFQDESLKGKHDCAGIVSMVGRGNRDSNNSQFLITTAPRPDLDGRNVVFGQVVEGLHIIVDATQKYSSGSGIAARRLSIGRSGVW